MARSVGSKILFVLIVVGFIVPGTMAGIFYYLSSSALEDRTFDQLSSFVHERTNHIQDLIDADKQALSLITSRTKLRNTLESYNSEPDAEKLATIEKILGDAMEPSESIQSIHVFDVDGEFLTFIGKHDHDEHQHDLVASHFDFRRGQEGYKIFNDGDRVNIYVQGPLIKDGKILGWVVLERDGSEVGRSLLDHAKTSFEEERYEEAEDLIEDVRESIETERANQTVLSTLGEGVKNFIQQNWLPLLIVLIVLTVGGNIFHKKNAKRLLRKKINKMKVEKNALIELMKKAQTQRFKENSISGLVYKARLDKYKDRVREIGEKLPVLEKRLKKS